MAEANALASVLPDYEISKELGRGAMGIVYLGRHRALDRTVAIKQLPASFASDPTVRERFLTEARVVAALDHPHVVVIHDFVDRNDQLALVMEHLPNGTVWEQFVNHGLAAPRACGLVLATLAGVHHAHERGIMHRDIKPENLIFTHDWQLKVTDFGIAQVLTGRETMATAEGQIVGTPAYMAPEQAEGRVCGPGADVYASGAMLYEMLTGSLPFPNAGSAMEMAMARLLREPVPILNVNPAVPESIADVTMQALARSEADRFASAEAFGVALAEAAADTWGAEWMSEAGTAVHGSDAIENAARTTGGSTLKRSRQLDNRPTSLDDNRATSVEDNRATSLDDNRATRIVSQPGAPTDNRPTQSPPPEPVRASVADMAAIVPQQRVHVPGADLHKLVPDDIFNLSEVRAPRSPAGFGLVAALALAAAAFFALVGLGNDPVPLAAGGVSVAGTVVEQAEQPVEVDLTAPFAVEGVVGESLKATFLGIPVGSAPVEGGVLDPGYLKYSAAGVIELASDDGTTSFPVRATHNVYLTAPFIATAMIALGALATVQANLRGMRARRVRVGPYVGLAASGAISGAALSVLAMLLLATPASISTVIATAATSAVGAVALGEAFRRWRRRRRLRKVMLATARRAA